jgi:hypothetical protein
VNNLYRTFFIDLNAWSIRLCFYAMSTSVHSGNMLKVWNLQWKYISSPIYECMVLKHDIKVMGMSAFTSNIWHNDHNKAIILHLYGISDTIVVVLVHIWWAFTDVHVYVDNYFHIQYLYIYLYIHSVSLETSRVNSRSLKQSNYSIMCCFSWIIIILE